MLMSNNMQKLLRKILAHLVLLLVTFLGARLFLWKKFLGNELQVQPLKLQIQNFFLFTLLVCMNRHAFRWAHWDHFGPLLEIKLLFPYNWSNVRIKIMMWNGKLTNFLIVNDDYYICLFCDKKSLCMFFSVRFFFFQVFFFFVYMTLNCYMCF